MKNLRRMLRFPHPPAALTLLKGRTLCPSEWRTRPSRPTGGLRPCWPQIPSLASPRSPACCPLETTWTPSSPARTQSWLVCPPSSPAHPTAERHPATDTARVSSRHHPTSHPAVPNSPLFLLLLFKSTRCSAHRVSSATCSCWTGRPATRSARRSPARRPAGAAAPSPSPRCTPRTPPPPSTHPPPSSPPPEMSIPLHSGRADRARSFRRP